MTDIKERTSEIPILCRRCTKGKKYHLVVKKSDTAELLMLHVTMDKYILPGLTA